MLGAMDAHTVAYLWATDHRPAIVLAQSKRRASPTNAEIMAEVERLRREVRRLKRRLDEQEAAQTAMVPQVPRDVERKT